MSTKAQIYAQMADEVATRLTGSWQEWAAFLTTAARLYKYPYHEQMMIYAQRPDATACAEYDLWNEKMGRYVRRGSKGIALIDDSGDRLRLRYVFDVSDTGEREHSRRPYLWQLQEEHHNPVSAMLEQRYAVYSQPLAQQLADVAGKLADEYWNDHQQELLYIVDGSFLEEYDELNIGLQFKSAVTVSMTYALMSRCGLEPEHYFDHEDFMAIFDFNTPATVAALGTAVSQLNQQVLRQIGITIQNADREKFEQLRHADAVITERRQDNEERTDIYEERGLSGSQPGPEQNRGEAAGQVRQDAENLSEGTAPNPLQPAASVGEIISPSFGDRGNSEPASGADAAQAHGLSRSDRSPESQRSDEMGGTDEQLQGTGGGSDSGRTYQQLTLNLFPSEQEQIKQIESEPSVKTSGSFLLSQADLDAELRNGSGVQGGKLRIYGLYQHQPDTKTAIKFLKEEYGWYGHSHTFLDGSRGIVDYSSKGMEVSKYHVEERVHVKWAAVEKRVRQLIAGGSYLTEEEKSQFVQLERDFAGLEGGVPMPKARYGYPETKNTPVNTVGHEITEADIDTALREWNGDPNSKQAVAHYMEQHGREKDTAEWLKAEYGNNLPAFPVTVDGTSTDVPWPRVQRRIAQLIRTEQYYIPEEQNTMRGLQNQPEPEMPEEPSLRFSVTQTSDAFPDPEDAYAVWDDVLDNYYAASDGRILTFPNEEQAQTFRDRLEQETAKLIEGRSENLDLSGYPMSRTGETITIGNGATAHEIDITVSDEVWEEIKEAIPDSQPAGRDPLAPAYQTGDTVYLDHKPFEITEIRDFEVQLLDPSLPYPLFRVENKENFARLLQQDTRNGAITEFFSIDPEQLNADLREALAGSGGLFNWRDKDIISGYFLEGKGNTKIAQYLSERYAGTVETMELETGETLDYFGSTVGFEVEVQDKYHSRISNSWAEIVPMLRGFYQQEQDGFYHVPLPPKRVHLEGTPVYGVGDSVTLDFGNRIVSGTVGYVGEQEVRVDIGPYSWSHETFSREQFDEVLRLDERNSHLFMSLSPSVPVENYRITDEHMGTGGSKAKFRANMDAIYLLKELETDQRQATTKEQEVLSRYVGWGGLSDAFDESRTAWAEEYQELSEALTQTEYEAARASTLNAHYTSPTVIRAIYEAVEQMGFTSGNILEPSCGVGNFFGMLPESMAHSRLYGVELDSITGRIAKQLYPKADITVAGFETTDKRDFFDLAVGNVPFGQYKVNDPAYNKLGFNIHNYFFAKALDQVRPGGVVAFVTSRYTMDSKDSTVRKYLAQRADLLGAIRLPNNAFKANAGTEVVSDILFLQKRDRVIDIQPDWVHLNQTENGYAINSYFTDHPEMVLGRTTEESTAHGMDYTVVPIEALELSDQLHDAVKYIRGAYTEADPPELGENEAKDTSIPADPNVKNYSYTVVDGKVYYRENSRMVPSDLNTTAEGRVRGMVALRDCVRELIDLQMDAYTPDRAIVEKQSELNRLYDGFSAKYGLLNDRANRLAFSDDSSYYLLCSLEVLDDEGKLKRKADMFTKRTIKQHTAVTSVDTPSEALAVSIGEKARVDLPYMSKLCGKSEEEIISQLTGVIFKDPAFGNDPLSGWQTADEYLSGNVRQKLRAAKRAAVHDPTYAVNVSALEKAQPKDLDASEIEVRLGATWIDPDYYRQFMYEVLDTPRYLRGTIDVKYAAYTAEWQITSKNSIPYNNIAAYTTYGTDRANAYRILEDSLNLRDVRIYDTVEDADGKEKRVLNAKETTLAAQKQQALRDAFKDWIWKDPERRQALVRQYNEEMNSTRPREYDGSHIVFSGMNPEIQLREHQKNAIAHVLYGGNTLLAHEVGAGKTFEMVAAAMESKRLGLCQKSIFVVPNHLTEQWASEFLRLYPSANILVTTKKDFETRNRKKFCARIATGDYDAVIIGHSQFERIPISRERQERLIQEQIQEITSGIEEVQSSGGERFTVKQLERTKKGLEARLEKLRADSRKDDVVTFEQLGCDRIFVDESDNYKNLFLYTKMRNVAGLSTTDAQKSSDMFAKCRYLDEVTGNRGTVFATGTPISNSMTEMYTIQRYLQYDRLKELNMLHFDCWASRFGETVTALELAPEGTGYRARTRFAKFFNLPELMAMFKEVADIKTADQLNLPTPEVEYHTYASKPTEIQQEMVKSLSERASKVHSGAIDPSVDNMLKITSDGRKLGLDQRIINPMLPDEESTKVNQCVDNVVQFWREGKENKLTQLVFCDISTPQAAPSAKAAKAVSGNLDNPELHGLETAIPLDTPEPPFTIYADIRKKLVEKGIPAEQVAFIHEANTDVRKKELFARVRSGQVRVLLGSTAKMGAGTNVQDRLIALHDLDCPWRPRDLTQRKGRIERQGNTNEKVHVCRYVTEGTFDAYLWQTVENKQKFISQIMSSKSPVRSCDDVDETALSFAEIKALCAGDPRIKERMDLDVDVSRLKIMKADHQSKQFRMEDNLLKYFPEQIEASKGFIKGLQADMETLTAHPHPADGFAGMEVRGDILTDKENAGAALLDACKEVKDAEPVQIGTYRGFSMSVSFNTFEKTYELTLRGQMTHRTALGADPRGNLLRIDNVLEKMPERLAGVQAQLDNLYQQQSAAQAQVGKPFPQEEELKIKTARLTELDSLLNMDGHRPQPEQAIAKNSRPSVLEGLKRPLPPRAAEKKIKSHEEVL